MTFQKGRDLALEIGDGAVPETMIRAGSARMVMLSVANRPVDVTSLECAGARMFRPEAGLQEMEVTLEGYFANAAAERALQGAALGRMGRNFRLVFPEGDSYAAVFMVKDYVRRGRVDDLEMFSVSLSRMSGGTFITGGG